MTRKRADRISTRTAHQQSRAKFERERTEAQAALDLEKEKAQLFEAQAALQRKKLEDERELGLAKLEADQAVRTRQAELEREAQELREKTALDVERARQERLELELAASIDKTKREAEAQRDAMLEVNTAQERKSQAVRDYEIATRVTDEIGQAMSKFQDPRWISIGQDSPLGAMAGRVAGLRELLAAPSVGKTASASRTSEGRPAFSKQ